MASFGEPFSMSCEYSDGIDEQFSLRFSDEMALDWMPRSAQPDSVSSDDLGGRGE
jgi:hypothetical protein